MNKPSFSGVALSTCAAAFLPFFFTAHSASAQTPVNPIWTGSGATNNWSDSANWQNASQPQPANASTVIHFAGSTSMAPNNQYAPMTLEGQVLFDSGAGSFTLAGNGLTLSSKIENDSSVLQTYNMSGLTLAPKKGTVAALNPMTGDLTINTPGSFITLAKNAELDVFGSHDLTLNAAIQDGANSVGKFVVRGPATVIFNGANTYTGGTIVDNGSLQFGSTGSAAGVLRLGDTTGSNDASLYLIPDAGGKTISNNINVRTGSSGTMTIGGLNTSGTNTYSGTVTLNRSVNLTAASGGTVSFNTITASSTQTATITGGGTVQFTGSTDNASVGATVNSGTLLLAKASSNSVHAVGSGLTVNNGGTVMLGGTGGDQIYKNSFVTINNGGTFKTAGLSEGSSTAGSTPGMGLLTLQGGATIDFATGANGSTLSALSGVLVGSSTISILNWTGTGFVDNGLATNDRLLFQNDPGFTAAQLAQFQFYNDSGSLVGSGAMEIAMNGWTELVAVPEASTWVSAALSSVAVLVLSRKRVLLRRRRA